MYDYDTMNTKLCEICQTLTTVTLLVEIIMCCPYQNTQWAGRQISNVWKTHEHIMMLHLFTVIFF